MKAAATPPDEQARLEALRSYDILDTPWNEQEYDDLVALAAAICGTPMAAINFVDADRQWGKAMVGLGSTEAPREASFCAHAILGDEVFEVRDTHADERFADNPQVLQLPHLRFYAGAPLVNPEGHALGSICALDTVPRKLTEEQRDGLRRLARQVGAQLELRRANVRLRELDRMKDEFVSLVSHELRTPLTSIIGFVELLAGEALDEHQRQYLQIVEQNTDRLLLLVDDLLTLAKIDAGLRVTRRPLDLGPVVEQAIAGLEPLAKRGGVELFAAVPDADLVVDADRTRIAQLLDNLVGNAVKFTPAGGRVDVTLERENGVVRLAVADTGIGVPFAEHERLFERFFRASTATGGNVAGTGLGLAIAKAIVEAHDGRISFTSEPGRGTTFRVELPGA